MASELERKLRATPDLFILKPNLAAQAVVWKEFSLIYEKKNDSPADGSQADKLDSDATHAEVKYYCAWNKCRKVYAYKAANGSSYGTKNLLDHAKQCSPAATQTQLQLTLVAYFAFPLILHSRSEISHP